jgi:hypothetical protein
MKLRVYATAVHPDPPHCTFLLVDSLGIQIDLMNVRGGGGINSRGGKKRNRIPSQKALSNLIFLIPFVPKLYYSFPSFLSYTQIHILFYLVLNVSSFSI